MTIDKIVDLIGMITHGMRKKRMHQFLHIIKPSIHDSILDIGGYPDLWLDCGYKGQIVFLNLEEPEKYCNNRAIPPNCSYIQGDGRCLNFPDKNFDIVFSNSVIEHVGSWKDQKAFAREASRVGERYWIQTPNKNFPIEPHFNFPLFQFLPLFMRKRIAVIWPFSYIKRWKMDMEAFMRDLRLLTIEQMQTFFPDGHLWEERLFGFVKSIVMYHS